MDLPYEESLNILKLAPRLQNALEEHGIFTIGDLLHCSLADLPKVTRPRRAATPPDWRDLARFGDDWTDGCGR